MRFMKILIILVMFTLSCLSIAAQENRETGLPDSIPTTSPNLIDPESYELIKLWDDFVMQDDWTAIELPALIPSYDYVAYRWDTLPHPFVVELELASSATDYIASLGFADHYLNTAVYPIFASVFNDTRNVAQPTRQDTMNAITRQFPTYLHPLFKDADALGHMSYWGILADGVSLIYTGHCQGKCALEVDELQEQVGRGSLGAYAVYREGNPQTVQDITYLLYATYPELYQVGLAPIETELGSAFKSISFNPDTSEFTGYYAGILPIDGQSIVYAVVVVGEDYINLIPQ